MIKTLKTIEQFQESSKPPGKPNGKNGEKGSNGKKHKGNFKKEHVPMKNQTGKIATFTRNIGVHT